MNGISTHLASSFKSKQSDVIDNDIISLTSQIEIRSFAENRETMLSTIHNTIVIL